VKKTFLAFAGLALVALLALTGCGSSNSSGSSTGNNSSGGAYGSEESSGKPAAATPKAGASITIASAKGVGKVLVDSEGMTLYYFEKDKKGGTESACYGPCEAGWPPLSTEGKPQAGEGAVASQLGTIERKDGTMQVTYAGWPLYTFVEDKKPGEDNGTDSKAFGASWYPLHANGEKAGH
jgi:predicted lipoprotein with Yx(FWY)xxD motif